MELSLLLTKAKPSEQDLVRRIFEYLKSCPGHSKVFGHGWPYDFAYKEIGVQERDIPEIEKRVKLCHDIYEATTDENLKELLSPLEEQILRKSEEFLVSLTSACINIDGANSILRIAEFGTNIVAKLKPILFVGPNPKGEVNKFIYYIQKYIKALTTAKKEYQKICSDYGSFVRLIESCK